MRLVAVLLSIASASFAGCSPKVVAKPDRDKAYEVAEDTPPVKVWVPVGPGAYVKTDLVFHQGAWCAEAAAVGPLPSSVAPGK